MDPARGLGSRKSTLPRLGSFSVHARPGWARRAFGVAAIAIAPFLVGCGTFGGGLKLKEIRSAQNHPSNVAVYFKVQTSSGEPVGGLTADKFRIYEDGELVSEKESKQTILNPEVAVSHYTLLLVDMSGSVSSDPEAVDNLVEAADAFIDRVEKEKSQRVAVYAFDGSEDLHPIASFTSPGGAKGGISQLKSFKPKDPSTNLNGAVMKGLEELDHALAHAEHPMHFGTLVVFSDGTDRARRVPKEDMRKAVDDSPYEIFAIGLGTELDESELKGVGKDGTAKAADKAQVVKAFDEIAQKIEASSKSYYLLSYCSPSRAGKHAVKIEAVYKPEDGKSGEKTGALESEFDATGFTYGCDPNTPPHFDVTKGDALVVPKKDDDDDGDKQPKKEKPKAAPKKSAPPPKLPPPPAPPPQQQPSDFNP